MAAIPSGLTSLVQPLDFCINKSFKDKLWKQWNVWMLGEESYTKRGLSVTCVFGNYEWIDSKSKGWNKTGIKSFKKCAISENLDGIKFAMMMKMMLNLKKTNTIYMTIYQKKILESKYN